MAGEEDYAFGPFHLEVSRRRLLRQGQRVPLTPKALDTLIALVRRAGQTVDKDDLLKTVWAGTFVEEATLAQNIAALRRVFGETPDNPTYISTVHRRGYRFIAPVEVLGPVSAPTVSGSVVPPSAPTQTARFTNVSARGWFWIALAVLLLVGLRFAGPAKRVAAHIAAPSARFMIAAPEGARFSTRGGFMAVSPNGRLIAFVASRSDQADSVWLRALDALEVRPLAGTEGASQLFWAPDSESLAFFAEGKLKKVAVDGGAIQVICEVPKGSEPLAGTWSTTGEILFSEVRMPIYRISASGGVPEPVKLNGRDDHETTAWPQFLPDGRRFLYVVQSAAGHRAGLYLGTLDGSSLRIGEIASYTVPVPGYLLYVDRGMLLAQPFDTDAGRLTGAPTTLAYRVAFNPGTLRGVFTSSQNGLLAFRTADQSQLTWMTRTGTTVGTLGNIATYLDFSVSPDGSEVAASVLDASSGHADIQVLNADGSRMRRLTSDSAFNVSPLWSKDGSQILFVSRQHGTWRIIRKASREPAGEERVLESETLPAPEDWLADGRVLFRTIGEARELRFVEPGRAGSQLLMRDPDGIGIAKVSPDGRWLAYEANPGSRYIVVRSTLSNDRRWELSSGEGLEPRWRSDGREIYYLGSDLSVMAVSVAPGPEFRPAAAARLFHADVLSPSGVAGDAYDVAPDGQRFLLKVPVSRSDIVVITNWPPS